MKGGARMNTAGIDVGGTQLRAAVFDESNRMIASQKVENDRALSGAENLNRLIGFLRENGPLSGVGVGCPGPLDLRRGKVLNPPNLVGWDNFEIVAFLEDRLGVRAVLNNDANVAGLAEALLGAGKGCESVAFVGVSTGIGGAFVHRGRLYCGANGNAAEFWNMIVNDDRYCHRSANPGSLNEQCSGSGLARIATERYGRRMDARELFERSREGDPTAREIVIRQVDTLARGIANITCTLDPEVIVIGGSVALHNPEYVELARWRALEYVNYPDALDVRPAKFGDDAGLIGAALLARS